MQQLALAARRESAIVRRRRGPPIRASRIFCRDQGVVLIDRYGFLSRLGYDDIIDAIPTRRVVADAPKPELPSMGIWAVPAMEPDSGAPNSPGDNVIAFRRGTR